MEDTSLVKVAIIGDKGVGKTSIIQQALYTEFKEEYNTTNSACCYNVTMFSTDKLFHVVLIDTPRFDENDLTPQNDWVKQYCYRKCSLFVLVYDALREESFGYVKMIHNEIAKFLDSNEFPVIIVGNRVDEYLVAKFGPNPVKPPISEPVRKEIANFSRRIMKANYVECSAKYNWNLVRLLKEIAGMLQAYEEHIVKSANNKNTSMFNRQQCLLM